MRPTRSSLCLAVAAIALIAAITVVPGPGRIVLAAPVAPLAAVDEDRLADSLLDPDHVGPCPDAGFAVTVVRQGRDASGRATWWARDGSLLRMESRIEDQDGVPVEVPVVLVLPSTATLAPSVLRRETLAGSGKD